MGRPKLEKPSPKCQTPRCRRIARVGNFCLEHAPAGAAPKAPGALQAAAKPKADPVQGGNGKAPHGGNGSAVSRPQIDPEVGVPVEPIEPDDIVSKMDPTEAEHWGRLLAELNGVKQAIQLLAMRQREAQHQHDARIAEMETRRRGQIVRLKEAQDAYDQTTAELCSKYKAEIKYAVIDVEGRVIREERPTA